MTGTNFHGPSLFEPLKLNRSRTRSTGHAIGSGGACLDILVYHFYFLSPSLFKGRWPYIVLYTFSRGVELKITSETGALNENYSKCVDVTSTRISQRHAIFAGPRSAVGRAPDS